VQWEEVESVIIKVNTKQNIVNDIESRTNHVLQDDLKIRANQDIEIAPSSAVFQADNG
jgi:hypothetical protein